MNLDEALAVHLYLRNAPPETRDAHAYEAAWDVICDHAQRILGRPWDGCKIDSLTSLISPNPK